MFAVDFRMASGADGLFRHMKNPDSCPCGAGLKYVVCCGRLHSGEPAATAEALMRSRYAAFVMGNESYLLATWHPSTRPASVPFDHQQKWLGLRILDACATGSSTAEIEFIARYRIGGASASRLHERSRFVKEGGRWFHVDGYFQALPDR